MSKSRSADNTARANPVPAATSNGWFAGWTRFWFTPADPLGLHVVRVLAGLLFLSWLLPFAGHLDSFFGLQGWFDRQAFADAARLPEGPPVPVDSWSLLFLAGNNQALLNAMYWGAVGVLVLFTLGVFSRLTAVLTWLIVASFTTSPAIEFDADCLLGILACYLMIGYLLTGQRQQQSLLSRFLGSRDAWLLGGFGRSETGERRPSIGANLGLRLLQVHFAIVLLATGLHKLQYGDWWAGLALWYPLHPPFETTLDQVRALAPQATTYMTWLSLFAYAVLAWQIGFPLFAWRTGWWRLLLVGGGIVGWVGVTWVQDFPLFGPAILIGCLSYLTSAEWQRLAGWVPGGKASAGARIERSVRAESAANLIPVEQR